MHLESDVTDPSNIARFNLVTLHLVTLLYENFPTPFNISDENIVALGFAPVPEDATEEEAWATGNLLPHVLTFLQEEGFLRYDPDPNETEQFWNVRLTLKGLTIMGVPSALDAEARKTLYDHAKESLARVSADAGRQVTAEIFKLAVFGLGGTLA